MYLYLIDDEPVQHHITKFYFQQNEAITQNSFFFDATLALQWLINNSVQEEKLPDIILLDLNMPIMDGWGFLYKLSEITPALKKSIKVFIVSSSITESDISKSKSFPFVKGFYSKPISPLQLKEILSQ